MAKSLFQLQPAPFTEPWNQSFSQRYGALLQKSHRVAYFYDQFDNSTFRYRVYNPCQTLNEHSTSWSGSFFFLKEQQYFESIVKHADIVVLCRVKYSPTFAMLLSIIRAHRKKALYDVDDLVFDIDLAHYIANNNGYDLNNQQALDSWFAYVGRIGVAMRMCDGAITTNSFLATEIKRRTGLDVSVMSNYLNKEQLDYSHKVTAHKIRQPDDGIFKIGYFSGSPSHEHDFAVASIALSALMKEYPQVQLVLVGYIARSTMCEDFRDRVTSIDFHDYVNLQRVIGSVDLNIAPLQQNIFANCKSELKLFEASVVLTPTLATPTFTFASAIKDGVDGYLANDMQWLDRLRSIIETNPSQLAEVALRSQSKCLERYSWDKVTNEVVQALSQAS